MLMDLEIVLDLFEHLGGRGQHLALEIFRASEESVWVLTKL
jgi:hypothetical protein